MPEIICLISSSPLPVVRRSKTPSASKQAPRSRNGPTKPATATATATFDLTGDTPAPAPKTKKTYVDSTFSAATSQNAAPTVKNPSPRAQKAADNDANAKMNDKDFVFVDDDDYSSELDLSKEYSLHLSQVRERIKNKVAAEAAAKANAPASSPVSPVKSTNSAAPAKSPLSSRASVIFTSNFGNPAGQSRYRAPVTAAAPKTLLDKPSGMTNKEYVFLDADFSSSIDLDKEYDLGLLAANRRKITPEPDAHQMSYRDKERNGLPGLFSSPALTRSSNVKEVEKRGLPDPFSPSPKRAKAKPTRSEERRVGKECPV